jgi:hypothetical protein
LIAPIWPSYAIRREFPLLSAGSLDASALRIDQRDFDEALVEQAGGSERPKSSQPVLFERLIIFRRATADQRLATLP